MATGNFHIDADTLQAVIDSYTDRYEPKADNADIEAYILADWEDAEAHQAWLDSADPDEIADWIAAGVFTDLD